MIRILRFLITGDWHLHKWEETRRIDITKAVHTGKEVVGEVVFCKCKHCGTHARFDLI